MMSNPDTPRRRFAVDLSELEFAFEDASWEASRYLDLETGQVITITDVFLANPRGDYVGRTCPWRDCRPGIRLSCDALHCGQRPYLHDDLQAIKLAQDLITAPPIELWPQVMARVPIPHDVEQGLISPLKAAQ